MNKKNICQSCGLPFEEGRAYAREADGGSSPDYCSSCMTDGIFNDKGDMHEMIEKNIPLMISRNTGITEEKAREVLSRELYPYLKRWQDAYEK